MYIEQIVPVIKAGNLPVSPAIGGHNCRTKAPAIDGMRVRRFEAALGGTLSTPDTDADTDADADADADAHRLRGLRARPRRHPAGARRKAAHIATRRPSTS